MTVPVYSPGSRIWLRGGAVLLEGRHIDNECMRSQGRIRKAGGVLSALGRSKSGGGGGGGGGGAVRFRPDTKSGGGGGAVCFRSDTKSGGVGGGGGCLPYDDLYLGLCARAWGMERGGGGGGGRQLVPEGGI